MRKLLLSILSLFAFAFASNAADIVFDMSDPNVYVAESNKVTYATTASTGVKYASGTVFTNSSVSFTATISSGNGVQAFTQSASKNMAIQLRVYNGSKLSFKTSDGTVITSIAVSGSGFNDSNIQVTEGAVANSAWTGSASEIDLTIAGSVQINTLTVTTASADAITAPTFSVAAGTYYVPKTVEITNPNGSGKVYYTLDGEDPTAESTEYSEPIEITTTTTLKAVVVDGDKSSDITSATYTIGTPDDVDNIAAFLAKDDGSAVKFTNPVTAVYQNGAYLYIKDDSGVALVYGSTGQTYANGDVVPAGFIGTKSNHNGLVELAAAAGEGTYKASTDKVDPIAATESELGKIDTNNINQYVCFKNVSYDATNKNLTDDEGGELALYSTFSGVKLPAADGTFDVSGFVSIYGTTIQLYPTEFISRSTVDNIADFKAMGKDAIAKVNCPLTVVAVYKTSSSVTYYAQDESGEGVMIFGAIADLPEYEAQDIIPAGFTGTYTLYNGIPEIYNCSDLAESTEQGTIKANGLSVDELGVDQVCDVVELQSVEILDIDEKSFNIKQDDVTVAAYNKFGLEELKAYINVTIRGIVSLISTDDGYAVEILPIEIDYSKGTADEAEISDEDDIIISTGDGSIIVEGGDEIQIVTPDGRATTVKGSGDTPDKKRRIIQTENGIYIVVVDGEVVEKVYVE